MRRSSLVLATIAAACGASSEPGPATTPVPVSRPAAAAPRPPAPRVAASGDGDLGTPHPLLVQAAAPDGSWVVACQAREDTDGSGDVALHFGYHGDTYGDELRMVLLRPDADELELEQLVARDPGGRWLAYVRAGRLRLHEAASGGEVELVDGLARGNDDPTLAHRAASFDDAGRRLLYLRGRDGAERAVVRELATAAETELDHGSGRLWRAWMLGDGDFLAAAVIAADTNGNGTLDPPVRRTSLSGAACRGPVMSYSTSGGGGDDFELRLFRADGTRVAGTVVAADGAAVVVQSDDGGLRWIEGDTERAVAPPDCRGEVLTIWPPTGAALVACHSSRPAPLRVYDPRGVHDLGQTTQSRPGGGVVGGARLVPLSGRHLVDLATARLLPRAYAGEQGLWGSRLLETVAGNETRVRDLDSGAITPLVPGQGDVYVHGQQHGRWVALHHGDVLLVDMREGRVVGRFDGAPTVVREDGAGLLPARVVDGVPFGPLRWQTATPLE